MDKKEYNMRMKMAKEKENLMADCFRKSNIVLEDIKHDIDSGIKENRKEKWMQFMSLMDDAKAYSLEAREITQPIICEMIEKKNGVRKK